MLNVSTTSRIAGLFALFAAGFLPVAGTWWRAQEQNGCALDGLAIDEGQRVRVLTDDGESHTFCSIICAELWLESSNDHPDQIFVLDEITGGEINSAKAFYVRSGVITHAPTGDRRHSFAKRADADAHAETFRGRELTGDEKPFAVWMSDEN